MSSHHPLHYRQRKNRNQHIFDKSKLSDESGVQRFKVGLNVINDHRRCGALTMADCAEFCVADVLIGCVILGVVIKLFANFVKTQRVKAAVEARAVSAKSSTDF